jgi:hypothetical protein
MITVAGEDSTSGSNIVVLFGGKNIASANGFPTLRRSTSIPRTNSTPAAR